MLYGRAGEQAALAGLLAGAREGRSGALVLRGEPGIGKSALLEYAAEQADGFTVLRATGVESEADLPFAGLHLLLAPALHLLPALPVPQRRALEAAFGLAAVDGPGGGPADRLLGGLATLGLLAESAAERPLLCLVDDAQWLDHSSAEALLLAARRLGREGLVLLFAARDGAGGPVAPGLPELRLAPLEPAAAAELLAARSGAAAELGLRYRVLAEAQGNPLALTELPAALAADRSHPAGELALTERLRRAFHGQVAGLPEPARQLLLLAAAEESGEPALLLRAAGELGAGAAELSEVERAGLLRRGPEGRYRLRHPLLRTAILESTPLPEVLAVHRLLGTVLRADGEGDRGSWHLALAATGPDAELAEALEGTARRAVARGGHAGAAAAYERAAALAPEREQRVRCLVLAAESALDAAEPERAAALALRGAELAEDAFTLAVLDWVRGTAEFWRGGYPEAHRLLLAAVGRGIEPGLAARLLLQAFHTAWYLGEEQVVDVLDRLTALALPAADAAAPLVGALLACVAPAFGRPAAPGGPRREA
ncbi:AAA family ATPase, partial [Kitasatospora sp. LaBMicrA B282]|uniref:AAA family ATPase n=1 Tax=Kitasatospora sp. LaBMicrA B282 TaxID=3420949 RepID=UPI003D12D25A